MLRHQHGHAASEDLLDKSKNKKKKKKRRKKGKREINIVF
jgi:hypothetical protein